MEYTHDNLLALIVGLLHRQNAYDRSQCRTDADDSRRFDEQLLHEAGSLAPTAHVIAGRPRIL